MGLYGLLILYRGEVLNVINFERKKMLPLTQNELNLHQGATTCYICGKLFLEKIDRDKNYQKIRDHCHFIGKWIGPAHSICNLRFNVPNEIPVVFHNFAKL